MKGVLIMEDNINVLDELNKGATMGMDAINFLISKVKDEKFKLVLLEEYFDYEAVSDNVNKLYSKYSDYTLHRTSIMNKIMTWWGVNIRMIKDNNDSKIAEMLLQGTNMGIIEGRRLLNQKKVDKKIRKLLNAFVSIQEKNVETLKAYL